MGNGKSEMKTQAMKMPIPTCLFWHLPSRLPPSHDKLLIEMKELINKANKNFDMFLLTLRCPK